MEQRCIGATIGKSFLVVFFSLCASLFLGSLTALAADSPLNVRIFYVPNYDLPVVEGGDITFFYQIWNTGDEPVSGVSIADNSCPNVVYDAVAQDRNVNRMLDQGEMWSFFCTRKAAATMTNVVTVSGQIGDEAVAARDFVNVSVPPATADGGGDEVDGSGLGSANADGTMPGGLPNTGLGGKAKKEVKVKKNVQSKAEKIVIPSIGVKAKIDGVGLTSDGNMDVSKNTDAVSWFELGAAPGEKGHAVMAGHLDTDSGADGVFNKLDELKKGDGIFVVNADREVLYFQVSEVGVYDRNGAPMNEIFGPSDKARLRLITCAGKWNGRVGQYEKRLVVFADLAG